MNKQDWTYKKLGEVATFINGYPFKPSDWKDSGRKIIRIQNLNNPDAVYNFYDGSIDPKYLVSNGDVLISWSGSLGVFEWTEDEAILNQHIFKVVFNKEYINKKFFQYVVASRINEMKSKVHGVTMQHITKKEFDIILIPVPPIAEQERIVAELDLLSGIIEKKKEQLKAYDQLAQSIFYTMFGDPIDNPKGWETKKIGDFASCIAGATPSTLVKRYWEGGDIPWLSSGEVAQGRIYDTEKKITSEGYNNSSTKLIPPHTVVIALAGQGKTRGTVGVAEISLCTNQSICSILTNGTIDNDYLYYQLKYMYAEIRSVSNGEGGRGGLNLKIVSSFKVIVPPLSLQQEFAEKVEAIERQKALVQQSIKETQTMFDFTMDKYFG